MSFIISEDCTACDLCREECPNDAISEGDPIYIINPDRCTECVPVYDTQQCADVCPADACVPDADRPENRDALESKYKELHPEEV